MERFISFCGLLVMVGLAWSISYHRRRVSLRIVLGGLALQFLLAVVVLKTVPGQIVFRATGDFFTQVLAYVDHGSRFMFGYAAKIDVPVHIAHERFTYQSRVVEGEIGTVVGQMTNKLAGEKGAVVITIGSESKEFNLDPEDSLAEATSWTESTFDAQVGDFSTSVRSRTFQPLRTFAFGVLPTIVFFSSLMGVFYHLGIMQRIVMFFAAIMQKTLGTSGAESLSAAANIFVGQTEAPLVIRPYVDSMTKSELMAVMVGGFATIAGGVLAAFVGMGIDAGHLITASVISAPAALLIAKVIMPETEHSNTMGTVEVNIEQKSVNVIEAAATGASDGLKLALNVAAMLIAFLAMIAMFDAIVGWVGTWFGFVDGDKWSLAMLLGYLFYPLAWIMGIESKDCFRAGELLGLKMAANEFVAYYRLSGWLSDPSVQLSERTIHILTYALCGFANFSSIGIQIGGIGGIAPERRSDLAKLGLRAMLGGTLAAFMTACIAGILI